MTTDRSLVYPFLFIGLACLAGLTGCGRSGHGAAGTDERTIDDLLAHLKQSGIAVKSHEVYEYPEGAKAWNVKGQAAEFYILRFDMTKSSEKEALKQIIAKQTIPWGKTVLPARVNGSFVLIGFESKDGGSALASAFDSF